MGLVDTIGGVFKFFVPPPVGSSDESRRLWQWKVALTLGVLIVTQLSALALALGLTPFFSGFAHSQDVKSTREEISALRMESLDGQIFSTRDRQCAAILVHNPAALKSLTERLGDKISKYNAEAWGKSPPYRLPGCEEF